MAIVLTTEMNLIRAANIGHWYVGEYLRLDGFSLLQSMLGYTIHLPYYIVVTAGFHQGVTSPGFR